MKNSLVEFKILLPGVASNELISSIPEMQYSYILLMKGSRE